jgi:hypothetical protein
LATLGRRSAIRDFRRGCPIDTPPQSSYKSAGGLHVEATDGYGAAVAATVVQQMEEDWQAHG